MGWILIRIALVLPVAAGVLGWPWWMVLVCGLAAAVGYFLTYPWAFERVRARGGVARIVAPMVAANSAACAALFMIGRLIS
jgi:hypothetical protein